MTEAERCKVNYVKGELNNYNHLRKKAIQYNHEAEYIQTQINKVTGGSPAIIPTGESNHNPHWRSPLYEELEQLEKKIDVCCFRVKQVDKFLAKLQPNDRQIIWDLHVSENNKKTYHDYCYEVYMSRKTLQRYVSRLIIKNWQ